MGPNSNANNATQSSIMRAGKSTGMHVVKPSDARSMAVRRKVNNLIEICKSYGSTGNKSAV